MTDRGPYAFAGVLAFVGGLSPDLLSGLGAIASVILAWVWFEGRMKKAIDEANKTRDALYAERWAAREAIEAEKWKVVHEKLDLLYSAVPKRKEDRS